MDTSDSGHTICRNCDECIDCGVCKCGRSTFNLKHLEYAIQNMSPRSKLYEIIKKDMKRRGHWRYQPRGNSK